MGQGINLDEFEGFQGYQVGNKDKDAVQDIQNCVKATLAVLTAAIGAVVFMGMR